MNLFKKNKKRFITRQCMNSDYSSELRGIFYILKKRRFGLNKYILFLVY